MKLPMSNKSPVKSAFAPIKAHSKIGASAATSVALETAPKPKPKSESAAALSPIAESSPQTITTELWVQLVNDPLKNCPCWAFLDDPHKPLFGSAIGIVLRRTGPAGK